MKQETCKKVLTKNLTVSNTGRIYMTTTEKTSQIQQWTNLAQQLRVDSIRCTTVAGSGHPTSSMSPADIMAVLMSSHLRYDFDNPQLPNNDHLIFSKGHASPLLYSRSEEHTSELQSPC